MPPVRKPSPIAVFVTSFTVGMVLAPLGVVAGYNPFRTDTYGDAQRAGAIEFYFVGQYWHADDSTINNVTLETAPPPNQAFESGNLTMSFDDAFVYGFGLGYNLNTHFTVRGEFTVGQPDYRIKFNNLTGRGEAFIQAGKFNLDYSIIRGPVTPFVSAGVGYFYIDSGIPTGPTEYWYWWDYWWGYGYDAYTPTHTETWFTANAAAGVRWDINERVFLKVSVGANWMNASADWLTAIEGMVAAGWKF